MPRIVTGLASALREGDELVAHVDEGHARHSPAKLDLEDLSVKAERLLDVADLERDVVDPGETGLGHGFTVGASPRRPTFSSDTSGPKSWPSPGRESNPQPPLYKSG